MRTRKLFSLLIRRSRIANSAWSTARSGALALTWTRGRKLRFFHDFQTVLIKPKDAVALQHVDRRVVHGDRAAATSSYSLTLTLALTLALTATRARAAFLSHDLLDRER